MTKKAHNAIDYTDLETEYLKALYFVEHKRHKPYWMFRCKCGTEKLIDANRVKSGIIKSCVCYRNRHKPKSFIHRLYKIYERSAKKRNINFNINKEFLNETISNDCFYCGSKPNLNTYSYIVNGYEREINGIDRVDSHVGYQEENCVACCKTCNYLKGELGYGTFLEHCKKIVEYRK